MQHAALCCGLMTAGAFATRFREEIAKLSRLTVESGARVD